MRLACWRARATLCGSMVQLALAATSWACGRTAPGQSGATGSTPLDQNVRWHRSIELEENRAVVNVMIRVLAYSRGGFLVSDEQEDQIRRYDSSGRLVSAFGRRGGGPKEFTYLLLAAWERNGNVLAVDGLSRAAELDSTGAVVLRTFRLPVTQLKFASLVQDTLLLLGGQLPPGPGVDRDAHLHLWNLRSGRLVASFLDVHPSTSGQRFAVGTAGLVGAALHGDTIAAVFALSDTVYLFDLAGRRLGAVPIPSTEFRRFDPGMPPPRGGIVEAREWFSRFSLISEIYWRPDGRIIVQYQDRRGVEPRWSLIEMRLDGRRVFESTGTPRLLASDPRGDTLWFVKERSPAPNEWTAATLRN
jgi:hypothetical protein